MGCATPRWRLTWALQEGTSRSAMLVTAQRVTSPSGDRSGINAFLYSHGQAGAEIDWSNLESARVPEIVRTVTAHLDAELLELAPGGNAVSSFLDVLAPDGTSSDLIMGVLRQGVGLLQFGGVSSGVVRGPIALQLNAALIPPERRQDEFRQLTDRIDKLLSSPKKSDGRRLPPLRVVASRFATGWRMQLDEAGAARVRSRHPDWKLLSVTADDEVLLQLRQTNPDLLPHVLASAVGLSVDQAFALGGVEVVDNLGARIRHWPDRG